MENAMQQYPCECDFRHTLQATYPIINDCKAGRFRFRLGTINKITSEAIQWLKNPDIVVQLRGVNN